MTQLEPTSEIEEEKDELKTGTQAVFQCQSGEREEDEQEEKEQEKDNHSYQNDAPCRGECKMEIYDAILCT